MLNLGRISYQGYCQDARGIIGASLVYDRSYGIYDVEQCAVKCSTDTMYGCVAFAYKAPNKYCGLFRGGPYTTGDGNPDITCYLMEGGI